VTVLSLIALAAARGTTGAPTLSDVAQTREAFARRTERHDGRDELLADTAMNNRMMADGKTMDASLDQRETAIDGARDAGGRRTWAGVWCNPAALHSNAAVRGAVPDDEGYGAVVPYEFQLSRGTYARGYPPMIVKWDGRRQGLRPAFRFVTTARSAWTHAHHMGCRPGRHGVRRWGTAWWWVASR